MRGDLARKERFGLAIKVGSALYFARRVRTVVEILAVRSFILIVC